MISTYILNRLNNAADLTSKSNMDKRHGAIIYNKKRPVSIGYNTLGSSEREFSRHAEASAITKYYKNKGKIRLYVARISKGSDGIFMNSRPCNDCIDKMKKVGIYEVIYSTGDKQIYKKEKVSEMKYIHVSAGNRHLNDIN
jgi:deoxycytidylate deaminase